MVEAALGRGEVGSLLFVTDPAEINRLQRLAVDGHRLGIPALFGFDVIHGPTIFPVPIAMAASWDRRRSSAARLSRPAKPAPWASTGRSRRWSTSPEIHAGAGSSRVRGGPYLARPWAWRRSAGFRDQARHRRIAIAGPKHLAGYGAAIGGRDYDEVNVSDSELWNVYLPPFAAVVAAGAGNIMSAYMDLNGIPATGNRWLIDDVLRGTWGFEGFVVSDAQAVHDLHTHGFAADLTDAGARALRAGVDLEMAVGDPAYAHLPRRWSRVWSPRRSWTPASGGSSRLLRLGWWTSRTLTRIGRGRFSPTRSHREVARVAAERSAVLLRNEGSLLPLKAADLGSIAVIGPLADSKRDTLGPWVFDYDLDETVTVLEGIQAKVGGSVDVQYAPGVRLAHRLYASMFDMFPNNSPEDPRGSTTRPSCSRRSS